MCGILGTLEAPLGSASPYEFAEALGKLAHRGPDSSGVIDFNINGCHVTIGHRRLSILDLSDAGKQPFISHDKNLILVFNGEIYNFIELRAQLEKEGFRFKTSSDTEVLLCAWQAWGEAALNELVGMFAFAILDRRRERLFLARDAFGIKPLFYCRNENGFVFGSEIKALRRAMHCKLTAAVEVASDYLNFGNYDHNGQTFYNEVRSVKPGHVLSVSLDDAITISSSAWWQPVLKKQRLTNHGDAQKHIKEKFLKSVELHMRSDVPVGIALSGGLDSSAIACAVRHQFPDLKIHTFTYLANDERVNEYKWAKSVNDFIKGNEHYVKLGENIPPEELENLIEIQGEPFGSTSVYAQYKVYELAKENGIKVVLEGQGADELFAGYDGYPELWLKSMLLRGQLLSFSKCFLKWQHGSDSSIRKSANLLARIVLPRTYYKRLRMLISRIRGENFICAASEQLGCKKSLNPSWSGEAYRERCAAYSQFKILSGQTGLVHLLRHADRNAMHFSIENRVPFLSTCLAESVLSLPEEILFSNDARTKTLLRAAVKDFVPSDIVLRDDKIGFETPERDWLRAQSKLIDGTIEISSHVPFMKSKAASGYLKKFKDGRVNDTQKVWRLINYCFWYKSNFLEND